MDCNTAIHMPPRRIGRFRVIGDGFSGAGEILGALLPDPDRLMEAGEEVHSGRFGGATNTAAVRIGKELLLLKRYNRQGASYGWKYFLRPSKALRSWRTAKCMRQAGVPTPDPLLCLEERSFGLLGRAYLVTPFIEGEGNLWSLWPGLTAGERSATMRELAATVGRMHRCGILHGDLNWRNILVRKTGEGREFFLVDLDCCRGQQFGRLPVERDLMHFVRDLRRQGGDKMLEELFLAEWQARSEMAIPPIRTGEETA